MRAVTSRYRLACPPQGPSRVDRFASARRLARRESAMKRLAFVLVSTALLGGCATYYPAYPRPIAVAPAPAVYPAPVVVAPAPSAYFSFSYRSGPPGYYGGWGYGRPWGWRY
jgi:hypothetical protein